MAKKTIKYAKIRRFIFNNMSLCLKKVHKNLMLNDTSLCKHAVFESFLVTKYPKRGLIRQTHEFAPPSEVPPLHYALCQSDISVHQLRKLGLMKS